MFALHYWLTTGKKKTGMVDQVTFSALATIVSSLLAAYDLLQDKYLNYRPNSQIFARRGRKAPLQYRRMICDSHCTYNLKWVWFRWMLPIPCGRDRQYRILLSLQQFRVQTFAAHCYTNTPTIEKKIFK